MKESPPLFILTNDDGVSSPGLRVLEQAASQLGEVLTVAPEREKSAVSHSITLHASLRANKLNERCFSIDDGTPTDCVYIAIHHLAPRRPTMILSGINRGLNIANDVIYSGTVAAAREALLQNIPSMAFSMGPSKDWPVHTILDEVTNLLRQTVENGIPDGTLLNVNYPSAEGPPLAGYRLTTLGRRTFTMDVNARVDPRGREYLWIGGNQSFMEELDGSDCNAVQAGYASVTPIQIDTTAHHALEKMRSWPTFQEETKRLSTEINS